MEAKSKKQLAKRMRRAVNAKSEKVKDASSEDTQSCGGSLMERGWKKGVLLQLNYYCSYSGRHFFQLQGTKQGHDFLLPLASSISWLNVWPQCLLLNYCLLILVGN